MSEIKVEDNIKVNELMFSDRIQGITEGETYEVIELDSEGFGVFVNTPTQNNVGLIHEQIEKVEDKTEFTFPEMAQKLIDGDFEIGTELVTNDGSTYFVDSAGYGRIYGLKSIKNGGLVISEISASGFNATWKVKEQPIKEMSIEEIQKELGYKIKVTE